MRTENANANRIQCETRVQPSSQPWAQGQSRVHIYISKRRDDATEFSAKVRARAYAALSRASLNQSTRRRIRAHVHRCAVRLYYKSADRVSARVHKAHAARTSINRVEGCYCVFVRMRTCARIEIVPFCRAESLSRSKMPITILPRETCGLCVEIACGANACELGRYMFL